MTDAFSHLVADGNEVLELKLGKNPNHLHISTVLPVLYRNLNHSLVRTPEDIENHDSSFGPDMCHQVFGENENIFGYTDLHIRLYYSAASLQTCLSIEYTDKVNMFFYFRYDFPNTLNMLYPTAIINLVIILFFVMNAGGAK